MNIKELKRVIREEVKSAVKEELQDMLNEAVKVASQAETKEQDKPIKENLQTSAPKNTNLYQTGDPIKDILQETRANMSGEEYKNVYTGTSQQVAKPNLAQTTAGQMSMTGPEPGLDLSKLDFAKKAGAVYKKSLEKDKERKGLN